MDSMHGGESDRFERSNLSPGDMVGYDIEVHGEPADAPNGLPTSQTPQARTKMDSPNWQRPEFSSPARLTSRGLRSSRSARSNNMRRYRGIS